MPVGYAHGQTAPSHFLPKKKFGTCHVQLQKPAWQAVIGTFLKQYGCKASKPYYLEDLWPTLAMAASLVFWARSHKFDLTVHARCTFDLSIRIMPAQQIRTWPSRIHSKIYKNCPLAALVACDIPIFTVQYFYVLLQPVPFSESPWLISFHLLPQRLAWAAHFLSDEKREPRKRGLTKKMVHSNEPTRPKL